MSYFVLDYFLPFRPRTLLATRYWKILNSKAPDVPLSELFRMRAASDCILRKGGWRNPFSGLKIKKHRLEKKEREKRQPTAFVFG